MPIHRGWGEKKGLCISMERFKEFEVIRVNTHWLSATRLKFVIVQESLKGDRPTFVFI